MVTELHMRDEGGWLRDLTQPDSNLPWYVAPKYHAPGATVLNSSGEQVAEFEDLVEANLCVARVNGREQA